MGGSADMSNKMTVTIFLQMKRQIRYIPDNSGIYCLIFDMQNVKKTH